MFRTTIWFLVVSLVSFQTMGFSLFDWQTSYAQFQRWPANAKNTTSVSFRFKTNAETGLLLYVDDEGETQYLKLHLRRGFLLMALSDGKEIFNTSSKMLVNDLQWHNIVLELTSRRLAYILDGLTVAEHNLSMFTLKSSVYLGGLPHTIDVLLLTHSLVLFEQSFVGCVEDFRYGNALMSYSFPTTLLQSSGISEECKDACKPENPCRNQGACINKFAMAECVCTGTGYRGETCQKGRDDDWYVFFFLINKCTAPPATFTFVNQLILMHEVMLFRAFSLCYKHSRFYCVCWGRSRTHVNPICYQTEKPVVDLSDIVGSSVQDKCGMHRICWNNVCLLAGKKGNVHDTCSLSYVLYVWFPFYSLNNFILPLRKRHKPEKFTVALGDQALSKNGRIW